MFWDGTMLLTESDAGSDVGALTTSATKNADGSYSITGTKIFITNGDHDLAENIIHPVLARFEGDPAGKVTKKDQTFYESEVKTADFFIRTELIVTMGKLASIEEGSLRVFIKRFL